jgi:hypothetical protein
MRNGMARNVLIVLLAVCVGGCSPTKDRVYEARYKCDGGSPDEIDGIATPAVVPRLAGEVVRTVAEAGRLHVFIRSHRTAQEIERTLVDMTDEVPAIMSFETLRELPKGLPPKPRVVDVPRVMIYLDREKCARLGVRVAEINAVVSALGTKDIDTVSDATVKNTAGNDVRLRDVGTVTMTMVPSHVVRDYVDGRGRRN